MATRGDLGRPVAPAFFMQWMAARKLPSDATAVVVGRLRSELQECAGGNDHQALASLMQQAAFRRAGTARVPRREALGMSPAQLAGPGRPIKGPSGNILIPPPTLQERRADVIQTITLTRRLIAS